MRPGGRQDAATSHLSYAFQLYATFGDGAQIDFKMVLISCVHFQNCFKFDFGRIVCAVHFPWA